jgi:hypothetical protein
LTLFVQGFRKLRFVFHKYWILFCMHHWQWVTLGDTLHRVAN